MHTYSKKLTAKEHGENIRKAAVAYVDAFNAAQKDGFYVNVSFSDIQTIGQQTTFWYVSSVTLTETAYKNYK